MEPQRLQRILGLALPIIGGMVSQNVLNLVDTAMVGTLGDAALAAVGLGGFAIFMLQAMVLGVSTGVQATAARRKGEGETANWAAPLNAGLLIVAIVGPLLSLVLFFLVPAFYPYLNSDPAVIEQGVPYLEARVLAIIFVAFNYAFRGYWNAVDRSKLYMSTLVVMHSSNIVLNYILIFGKFGAPALGVLGAGIASALSTVVGTAMYIHLGLRYARENGFLKRLPSGSETRTLVRLALPNGVQQTLFSAGFVMTFWIIGQVGTAEVAAANVLINVTLVAILPGLALGMSASTLVGQALGRGDPEDAARWGWDVSKVGVVVLAILALPMVVVPDWILLGFIHNPDTLALARLPMRLVGISLVFEAAGLVLMSALLGAGDARRVMLVSVTTQWLVFLPLAYLVGPLLGFGLLGIWALQSLYRVAQAFIYVGFWRGGRWARIKV